MMTVASALQDGADDIVASLELLLVEVRKDNSDSFTKKAFVKKLGKQLRDICHEADFTEDDVVEDQASVDNETIGDEGLAETQDEEESTNYSTTTTTPEPEGPSIRLTDPGGDNSNLGDVDPDGAERHDSAIAATDNEEAFAAGETHAMTMNIASNDEDNMSNDSLLDEHILQDNLSVDDTSHASGHEAMSISNNKSNKNDGTTRMQYEIREAPIRKAHSGDASRSDSMSSTLSDPPSTQDEDPTIRNSSSTSISDISDSAKPSTSSQARRNKSIPSSTPRKLSRGDRVQPARTATTQSTPTTPPHKAKPKPKKNAKSKKPPKPKPTIDIDEGDAPVTNDSTGKRPPDNDILDLQGEEDEELRRYAKHRKCMEQIAEVNKSTYPILYNEVLASLFARYSERDHDLPQATDITGKLQQEKEKARKIKEKSEKGAARVVRHILRFAEPSVLKDLQKSLLTYRAQQSSKTSLEKAFTKGDWELIDKSLQPGAQDNNDHNDNAATTNRDKYLTKFLHLFKSYSHLRHTSNNPFHTTLLLRHQLLNILTAFEDLFYAQYWTKYNRDKHIKECAIIYNQIAVVNLRLFHNNDSKDVLSTKLIKRETDELQRLLNRGRRLRTLQTEIGYTALILLASESQSAVLYEMTNVEFDEFVIQIKRRKSTLEKIEEVARELWHGLGTMTADMQQISGSGDGVETSINHNVAGEDGKRIPSLEIEKTNEIKVEHWGGMVAQVVQMFQIQR